MDSIRSFVERYTVIPAGEWPHILAAFRRVEYKAGAYVLREGERCNHLSFLASGLLRYVVLRDGEEFNKFFTVAPYFYTSQQSFNDRTPARESIRAVEDSVAWSITYEENERLLQQPGWAAFGRAITQEVQFFTEEILTELQTETAADRYGKLLEKRPGLVARLPLKDLASYLGIAPQSLSRIRKKVARTRGS